MIYVTRPSPEGEKLTQLFNQTNLSAQHLPLFNISQGDDLLNLQEQLNQLLPNDIVIVVSPQVTHVINTYLSNLILPTSLRYYAIGKKSAQLFNQFTTAKVNYPNIENSEGLLAELQQESVQHHTILILCGNAGRQLLTQKLTSRAAKVKSITCYRRKPIHYSLNILSSNVEKQIIIITSLEHLIQLELYSNLEHKTQANLVVTSQRIFAKAKQLKWQKILLVNSANNQKLFEAVTVNYGITE
ncbi:uroporphyrinogen-III synthase [Gilliamella sp. ESL0250]|uniref:uroporphyrinogen-III synthase n=1 Tax=Gilliamella sp. ESL0250 TaxID=2705036 RepID=UPI00157FE26D|nr:uroporphyrinogen-III synthase [Gilliamella sp. ESL0250]NUF48858.1 uroporphyrinogen-III synthase [Gilliamella sp. ESL0250]